MAITQQVRGIGSTRATSFAVLEIATPAMEPTAGEDVIKPRIQRCASILSKILNRYTSRASVDTTDNWIG